MKLTCTTCGKEDENGTVHVPGLSVNKDDETFLKTCVFTCSKCEETGIPFLKVDCSLCKGTNCREWKYDKKNETLISHCSTCPNKV